MSKGSLHVVYRIKDDKVHIASVQQASLKTEKFGLEPTHGLFGSSEWWNKISSGELRVHTRRGVIIRRYMGSMNDWPEFTMRSDSGEETSWSRYGHSGDDDRHYQVGRRVEVDYVLQRGRPAGLEPETERTIVVEVRIEVPPETIRQRIIRQRTTGAW